MKQFYPRWAPEKGPDSEKRIVKDAETHEKLFPEDFKSVQRAISLEMNRDTTLSQAASDERERCAMIAENFQRGNKLCADIAKRIRSSATTFDAPPEDAVPVAPAAAPTTPEPVKA